MVAMLKLLLAVSTQHRRAIKMLVCSQIKFEQSNIPKLAEDTVEELKCRRYRQFLHSCPIPLEIQAANDNCRVLIVALYFPRHWKAAGQRESRKELQEAGPGQSTIWNFGIARSKQLLNLFHPEERCDQG